MKLACHACSTTWYGKRFSVSRALGEEFAVWFSKEAEKSKVRRRWPILLVFAVAICSVGGFAVFKHDIQITFRVGIVCVGYCASYHDRSSGKPGHRVAGGRPATAAPMTTDAFNTDFRNEPGANPILPVPPIPPVPPDAAPDRGDGGSGNSPRTMDGGFDNGNAPPIPVVRPSLVADVGGDMTFPNAFAVVGSHQGEAAPTKVTVASAAVHAAVAASPPAAAPPKTMTLPVARASSAVPSADARLDASDRSRKADVDQSRPADAGYQGWQGSAHHVAHHP